jgi:hypothetical protein
MLGAITIALQILNCLLCIQHIIQHRLRLDAVVEFNLRAVDVMLLHFDPRTLEFHDDAPLEQNMVRGMVIFDGEGIEMATGVEVLRSTEISKAYITTVSPTTTFLSLFQSPISCRSSLLFYPTTVPLVRARATQSRGHSHLHT